MRKRMESIKNTANNSNLNSIELTYLKKRKGLILNGEIKRDEDFDLLIQKLQKDHNNKFGILGNNNLGSVFKMDSLEKGITTDYESVFCLLKEGANEYNIEFEEGYYVTLTYSGDYLNNKEHIKNMFDFIEENKLIVTGNPITMPILNILLPTALPIAISYSPFLVAITDVTSSGKEVPRAIIVKLIIRSLTPKALAK